MTQIVLRGLAAAAVTASLVGSAVPAFSAEGETIKNILGEMGLVPKDKPPIPYRERAPLVLPPKMQLRDPVSPESFASANPQWPKDPEIVSREKQRVADRVPAGQSELYRLMDKRPLLSQDEMRAGGRTPGGGGAPDPNSHYSDAQRDRSSFFSSLFGGNDPAPAPEVAEAPTRRTLTDPPTAFRKSTGTAGTDYGARRRQENIADSNPFAFLVNGFKGQSDED